MVSTVMDVQECIVPDSPLPTSDKMSLDLGAASVEDIQLKEQSTIGDDFAPKVRKPYTITKQRERWTEEEHKKFLEALKLYGRAWRRIEDHVGSKTAVQIRSHAQKFFSKVVRESNTTGDGVVVKPIEIPPPRPKRKPMHPYPRKMPSPVKAAILIPKKPNVMGLENQSPTSVLSAVGSDLSAGADSCVIPNGSPSSFSSDLALNSGNVFGSEAPKLLSEDAVSYGEDENSCTDEDIPLDLDLPSPNTPFVKRDLSESAVQCLKLFGKTLLVDLNEQSCSTQETCNPKREDTSLFPLRVVPVKLPTSTSEDLLSSLVYSTPEIKSDVDFSPAPFLWLSLASDSYPEVLSPTPIKAGSLYTKNEKLENDEKEGSSTGSNTDLVGDKTWDIDSCPKRKGKFEKSFSSYKLSKRVSVTSSNCRRGFVPYKRCFAEQVSSPTEIVEEREKQRIRLCL